jgi:ribosome maturation factor RimP
MAPNDGIRALAQPLLASAGLRLWDVEVDREVVRVLVDRDGGVDLDGLSTASHLVSELLDDHDELVPSGRYQLEVSSPGLERVLRTAEHYGSCLGATVAVKTVQAVDGTRRHRGRLVAADDTGIELLADDASGGAPRWLAYDQIERTHTVLEWGPAPKPGARPKTTGRRSEVSAHVPAASAAAAHDCKDRAR